MHSRHPIYPSFSAIECTLLFHSNTEDQTMVIWLAALLNTVHEEHRTCLQVENALGKSGDDNSMMPESE
jgi:hypothetical protein